MKDYTLAAVCCSVTLGLPLGKVSITTILVAGGEAPPYSDNGYATEDSVDPDDMTYEVSTIGGPQSTMSGSNIQLTCSVASSSRAAAAGNTYNAVCSKDSCAIAVCAMSNIAHTVCVPNRGLSTCSPEVLRLYCLH